ncbi:MAG: hypothetical protein K6G15_09340 [Desulfovibrio sp.]|nr:hypothetical protein [Desulfovibrio sp.]
MFQTAKRTNLLKILTLCLGLVALLAFALQQTDQPKDVPGPTEASAPSKPAVEPASQLLTAQAAPQNSDDPIADIRARVAKNEVADVPRAQLTHASNVLQFANEAENVISEGWFAQADRIAFFIRIYLGEWELALLPKVKIARASSIQRLLPPDTLFPADHRQKMADCVSQMADQLDAMLKDYEALTAYVQDTSLMDEGRQGKRLAATINKSYERFSSARKSYFSLLEHESLPAEDLFLAQSPLRRQIIAARGIFALFGEITTALSQENLDREAIIKLQRRLSLLLAYAEEPPFKDSPLKERAFRAFLKTVHNYLADLDVGIQEGFYPHVRKALNTSQLACRTSYNDFANYLNSH